jgi:hypothetical protein
LAKEALQRAANHDVSLQTDRAAAVVKERNGQVKTTEERQDNGAENEMDGEDAIKLYNELVKSPEDRLALEKEIPSLLAARDKVVAKQKQLQKETAQTLEHVVQDAQVAQGFSI